VGEDLLEIAEKLLGLALASLTISLRAGPISLLGAVPKSGRPRPIITSLNNRAAVIVLLRRDTDMVVLLPVGTVPAVASSGQVIRKLPAILNNPKTIPIMLRITKANSLNNRPANQKS
jgi:hypothetical protein